MKGGYKLIDFKKVDINEEDVVIDGIFNSINSTTKRVVATNLNIGGFELKEFELSVVGDEGSYLLQCPFFKIMITDEDGVSYEVNNYANQSDLELEITNRTTKDTQLLNAIGGTLRQCLCVKETLDFDNTDVVDLSSLTWSYNNSFTSWIANFELAKHPSSDNNNAKIIATQYKTTNWNAISDVGAIALGRITGLRVNNGSISIKPSGLLAYEKAELSKINQDEVLEEKESE